MSGRELPSGFDAANVAKAVDLLDCGSGGKGLATTAAEGALVNAAEQRPRGGHDMERRDEATSRT